jgi:hypothetical protein
MSDGPQVTEAEAFLDDEGCTFRVDRDGNVTEIEARFEYPSGEVEDDVVTLAPHAREDGSTGRFDFDGKARRVSGDVFAGLDDDE